MTAKWSRKLCPNHRFHRKLRHETITITNFRAFFSITKPFISTFCSKKSLSSSYIFCLFIVFSINFFKHFFFFHFFKICPKFIMLSSMKCCNQCSQWWTLSTICALNYKWVWSITLLHHLKIFKHFFVYCLQSSLFLHLSTEQWALTMDSSQSDRICCSFTVLLIIF